MRFFRPDEALSRNTASQDLEITCNRHSYHELGLWRLEAFYNGAALLPGTRRLSWTVEQSQRSERTPDAPCDLSFICHPVHMTIHNTKRRHHGTNAKSLEQDSKVTNFLFANEAPTPRATTASNGSPGKKPFSNGKWRALPRVSRHSRHGGRRLSAPNLPQSQVVQEVPPSQRQRGMRGLGRQDLPWCPSGIDRWRFRGRYGAVPWLVVMKVGVSKRRPKMTTARIEMRKMVLGLTQRRFRQKLSRLEGNSLHYHFGRGGSAMRKH